MTFKRFQEYMKDKKTLVEKPPIETVPSYKGPNPNSPEPEKFDKYAGGAGGTKKSTKPYSNDVSKDPNKQEKGLAQEGDKDFIYEPSTDVKKSTYGGEELNSWPKSESVTEWLRKTRNMSNSKLIKEMKNESTSYGTIKEATEMCIKSKKSLEQLVMEMKRNNMFKKLIKELCRHEAAIPCIIEQVGGKSLLTKYLLEYDQKGPEGEEGEEGIDDDEIYGDNESEDMSDDEDHDDMSDDEDHDDMSDDEDHDDMSDDENHDDEDHDDEDHDDEDHDDEDHDDEDHDDMSDDMSDDDSALDEPIGNHSKHHHAKHALRKMGPPPSPNDEF